jgi:hypothetical protein
VLDVREPQVGVPGRADAPGRSTIS